MFEALAPHVGGAIVGREIFDGRIWAARPLHLLDVDDDLLIVQLARGSTWLGPARPDGSPHRVPEHPWKLEAGSWPYDNLWFVPAGEPFAVHTIRFAADAELLGWYVNVQEPIRLTNGGFDYLDHTLDVVVSPDLSSTELKDEDELASGVEIGLYSPDDAERIRAAADAGVAWLRAHHGDLERWTTRFQVPRTPLHLDDQARLVPSCRWSGAVLVSRRGRRPARPPSRRDAPR